MLGEDISSSSDGDDNDDSADESMEPADGHGLDKSLQAQQGNGVQPQQKQPPIIDADGFETVQRPARRRGPR